MTPKILSSCYPVGQPDSMTTSYLFTLLPTKPLLKAAKTKRLKLKHDKPLPSFAFKFNLRQHML